MKIYLFKLRYLYHAYISGKNTMPYDEWRQLMIDCNYTFFAAFTSYQHGWKILRFWRWSMFDLRFMWWELGNTIGIIKTYLRGDKLL